MGQYAQSSRAQRAVISIDWMLLVVAMMVMLFCIAAFIRITSDSPRPTRNTGLLSLSETDHLVAFQDFNHGSDGWMPAPDTSQADRLGPVLGPFSDEIVERAFQLPVDTVHVLLRFDLNLRGPWNEADTLRVSLAGQEAIVLEPSGQGDEAPWEIAVQDETGIAATVRQRVITPPTEADSQPIVSLTVTLQLQQPTDQLRLGFEAAPSEGATWSLDNLAVVATTDGAA